MERGRGANGYVTELIQELRDKAWKLSYNTVIALGLD
jgi:hypothetical protein